MNVKFRYQVYSKLVLLDEEGAEIERLAESMYTQPGQDGV